MPRSTEILEAQLTDIADSLIPRVRTDRRHALVLAHVMMALAALQATKL